MEGDNVRVGEEILALCGRVNPEDALGVVYLLVPQSMLETSQLGELQVTGSRANSRRLFILYDYQDTIERDL